jgi:hypothetical protein
MTMDGKSLGKDLEGHYPDIFKAIISVFSGKNGEDTSKYVTQPRLEHDAQLKQV